MKIEKSSKKAKVVAKKKENDKVESHEETLSSTVNLQDIPKVTIDTTKENFDESSDIQAKRQQMFKEEKERQRKIREDNIIRMKHRKIFRRIVIVTLIILFIFAPIYPQNEIVINDRYFLQMKDITVKHELNKYFSPFQFLRYRKEIANGNEYIKKSKVSYDLKNMEINVNIDEYIPLVKDYENNVYFYEDDTIIKKDDINLYAPVINGFDQKTLEQLLQNLSALEYDVLTLIDSIEYIGDSESPTLIKMDMVDNNTIFINMEQIKYKMPYYTQIQQIIDEKANGKPGYIHLNMGDYYEPK